MAAAVSGLQVALADLSPQGTTTGWYKRRKATSPALVTLKPGDSTEHIAAAGIDLLVIDTPPGQPDYIPALLASADVVLLPVRPTPDDLLAAAPIAKGLAKHPAWAFVISQMPPRIRLLSSAISQASAV